jgi:excisionase family DNA binding protein
MHAAILRGRAATTSGNSCDHPEIMQAPEKLQNQPALMNVREAAAWLRIGERKLYDLVAREAIPHSRAGAKILFSAAQLERWLSAHASGPHIDAAAATTVAGSIDPLFEWAVRESRCGLALLTHGSLDGVERLACGGVCGALIHVPSPDLADFNRHLADERLRGRGVALVEWARREQGLVVARGNPKRIRGMRDLARKEVTFMLRQANAGARVLFERLLEREGMRRSSLRLHREEAMAGSDLAAAIQAGEADAGLAARAQARLAGLDFVPLVTERIDLAVSRARWFDPPLQSLFAFARSRRFASHAAALGGYDVSGLGAVSWNDPQ